MDYNIFISWSKSRSYQIGKALHEWLPNVIQAAKPWISSEDIDKGTLWSNEIAGVLALTKVGIVCVTPENVSEPWLNFEAGALSKTIDDSRVGTYLFPGMSNSAVPAPLGRFNHTSANETDTLRLLQTIRRALNLDLTETQVEKAFSKNWPDFAAVLAVVSKQEVGTQPALRKIEEMMAELLEIARADTRDRTELEQLKSAVEFLTRTVQTLAPSRGGPYLFSVPSEPLRLISGQITANASAFNITEPSPHVSLNLDSLKIKTEVKGVEPKGNIVIGPSLFGGK